MLNEDIKLLMKEDVGKIEPNSTVVEVIAENSYSVSAENTDAMCII